MRDIKIVYAEAPVWLGVKSGNPTQEGLITLL